MKHEPLILAEDLAPWDQQRKETAKRYAQFATYRDLGRTRTLARAAETLALAPAYVRSVAAAARWTARAGAWDAHLDTQYAARMIEARRTAADQDARLLDGMLARVVAAVASTNGAELSPADTARWAAIVLRARRGLYGDALRQAAAGAEPLVLDPAERRVIGLDSDEEPTATETRATELIRLDRMQAALWPDAMAGDDRAVRTILRVMDRRARLLGLDTAKTIKTVMTTELDQRIADLTDRMRAAAAQPRRQ